jgi:hypothetical protein
MRPPWNPPLKEMSNLVGCYQKSPTFLRVNKGLIWGVGVGVENGFRSL